MSPREYLLSPTHPVGHSKARFFRSLGFEQSHWTVLRDALVAHLRTGDKAPQASNAFGQKYVVRGILHGPLASAETASVWIILHGESVPRFVTAYPGASR